jgi:hypothetical protein
MRTGKLYKIEHKRKGDFLGRLIEDTGDWATFEIVEGVATMLSASNPDAGAGEIIRINKSLARITEVQE